jgi:DNA recombination protein RmuC
MDIVLLIGMGGIGFLLAYVIWVPNLQKQKITLKIQLKAEQDKLVFINQQQQIFDTVAKEVLQENKQALQQENKQDITPLKIEIENFRKRLEVINVEQSNDRSALKEQIKILSDLSKNTIKEAEKLSNALTFDNKQQGDWGEMILESILQSSGLTKGQEYEVQKTYRDEADKLFKPDVVIHLPNDKDIVIDSKVSLLAYQNYVASAEKNDLKAHLHSVEEHIKNISLKAYEHLHGLNTLDYVFVFFPIEGSLLLALEAKPSLFSEAIKKNVALVSPSTLMMSLKVVNHIWQTEKQNKNTEEIARLAASMYDKLVGFVESLDTLEQQLKNANKSYEQARSRLNAGKGNVFSIAEKIKTLGVMPKKELKL